MSHNFADDEVLYDLSKSDAQILSHEIPLPFTQKFKL